MTNEQIIADVLKWCSEREVRDVMRDSDPVSVTKAKLLSMLERARADARDEMNTTSGAPYK